MIVIPCSKLLSRQDVQNGGFCLLSHNRKEPNKKKTVDTSSKKSCFLFEVHIFGSPLENWRPLLHISHANQFINSRQNLVCSMNSRLSILFSRCPHLQMKSLIPSSTFKRFCIGQNQIHCCNTVWYSTCKHCLCPTLQRTVPSAETQIQIKMTAKQTTNLMLLGIL